MDKLDHLYLGTFGGGVFQRRDGVAITEALLHELCQIPRRDEPARVVPEPKAKRSPSPEQTLQRQLADGLKVLKAKGVTSVGQILEHLNEPAGARLLGIAEAIRATNGIKKGRSGKKRQMSDIIKAAIAMRDRDRHNATS